MLRADKEQVVAELVERLRTAETLIVADYRGLTHAELDAVRTELLQHGARFTVVKNTLTKRAADAAGVDVLHDFLTGPTAIAFVHDGDMVAVARTLNETAKATRRLELKGGILDGKPIGADAVRDLATLPPVDILRGQVLGAIVAPVTSLLGLVTAPLQNLVGLIEARIAQLEAGGDSAAPAEAEAAPAEGESADEAPEDEAPGPELEDEAPGPEPEGAAPPRAGAGEAAGESDAEPEDRSPVTGDDEPTDETTTEE